MKRTKKLSLTTTKIRSLTDDESKRAAGGWSMTCSEADQTCGPNPTIRLCVPTGNFTNCYTQTQQFC